jgi:C-terminal processing protease CtpA/Prc
MNTFSSPPKAGFKYFISFIRLAYFMFVFLIFTFPGYSKTLEQTAEDIKQTAKIKDKYELDTTITLKLALDEGAYFACRKNNPGLTEIFLRPYINEYTKGKSLSNIFFWDDGNVTGGSLDLEDKDSCFLPMGLPIPPHLQVVFKAKWKLQGDKVLIEMNVGSNRAEIGEYYQKKVMIYNAITLEERVSGFSHMWNEIKYNFVFTPRLKELNYDKTFDEYLPQILKEQTTEDYYKLLKKFVARLHDSHTKVWIQDVWYHTDSPPIIIEPVEEKAIVTRFGKTEEIVKIGLRIGDEITHVDGRPVREILEQDINPYISASTKQDLDGKAYKKLLEGPISKKARIRIKQIDGTIKDVELTRFFYTTENWDIRNDFEYKELPDKISYVAINSFDSEDIVKKILEVFDKIKKSKGIIIDTRLNDGGSTDYGYQIISHLIDKPIKGSKWKTRQYMPVFAAWGNEEKWYEGDHGTIEPAKDAFLGPVVVLTGPGTFSAGEDFVVALHASKRATLVGEKTGGSTGQPLMIDLPKGGHAQICTKWDSYPDGREFVGIGIIPDIEIHPTQEDIVKAHDGILEKGIEVLKSKIQ